MYVDFDKKLLYSMYIEPASYEDYVPVGWNAKYKSFLDIIPAEKRYWKNKINWRIDLMKKTISIMTEGI